MPTTVSNLYFYLSPELHLHHSVVHDKTLKFSLKDKFNSSNGQNNNLVRNAASGLSAKGINTVSFSCT